MKASDIKLSLNPIRFQKKILKLFSATLIVSAAVALLVAGTMGKLMAEFSLFVLQDIAVIVNICFAMFFSLVMADNISTAVSKDKGVFFDTSLGLMTFIWQQIVSNVLSFFPYFIISSFTFIVIKYLFFGYFQIAFLQMLFMSYLSFFPLAGMAASLAVWIKNKVVLYLFISFSFFSAIALTSRAPQLLKILLPDMDFYQIDTSLFHGPYDSWLYIFFLFAIGLLWIAVLSSISSFFYDFLMWAKGNFAKTGKPRVLQAEIFIIFVSGFFIFYMNSSLKNIELEQKEKIFNMAVVPRTGFRGLWANFNFLLLCEISNRHGVFDAYKNTEQIKNIYLECLVNKPSFDALSRNAPFIFANINFLSRREVNKLIFESIRNYMKNPYIRRDALFEFSASSLLIAPSNPDREKYLRSVAELLRHTKQIASVEKKEIIFKQIVALNTELMQNASWNYDLIPLNKDFAELLAWYEEWERALLMLISGIYGHDDVRTIEKNLLRAADEAENSSMGNPNIISSVKEIRKKVHMAKYISRDKLPLYY